MFGICARRTVGSLTVMGTVQFQRAWKKTALMLSPLLSDGGTWSPCVAGLKIMSMKPPGWTSEVVELNVSLGSSCKGVGGVC